MQIINRQPIPNNNILTNNLTNTDLANNYIQKINEALNYNDKEMPVANRVISDVRHISAQQNYDPQKILSHIEKMMINFLDQQNFFDKQIITVESQYYKLSLQLDDLTKQIAIIEQEVSNYICQFPRMIKNSMHYKGIVESFFKPLDYIKKNISLENKTQSFITDLINAVNLVKEDNKLLPQRKILEEKIDKFIEYNNKKKVTQSSINDFINEMSFASNLKVAAFYPKICNRVFRLLEYLNKRNDIDLTASLVNYEYSCTSYEKKTDVIKKTKEHIKLANNIYKRINKLDKKILDQAYNIKTRAIKLKEVIAQN